MPHVLPLPAISPREVSHFRQIGPLVIRDSGQSAFEVGKLLLNLGVVTFVFFTFGLLASFSRVEIATSVNQLLGTKYFDVRVLEHPQR